MSALSAAGLTIGYPQRVVSRDLDLEIAEDVVTTWSRAAVRELCVDEHEEDDAADASADTDAVEPSTPDKTLRLDESVSDTERRLNKE